MYVRKLPNLADSPAINLIHRQFTVTRFQDYTAHGYTVFKFYPFRLTQFQGYTVFRVTQFFTRFYALLSQLSNLTCLRAFQGYTVFKFYPLSLRYRDPAASPLNARQYMFENQAIKLINRQLS